MVGNGFDCCIFIAALLLLTQYLDGLVHAVGNAVEFVHDEGEQGGWFVEKIFDTEGHRLTVEELDLEEAQFELDDLLDEDVLVGGDRQELFRAILHDREGDVVIVNEVLEVLEAVEAMLERV